jgi:ribosomal protein L27
VQTITIATAAAFAVLFNGAPAGGAAVGRKPVPKCPPAHWPVVIADSQAELYVHPAVLVEPLRPEEVYGCKYGQERSYELGQVPECGGGQGGCAGVTHEILAGPVVAYELFAHQNGIHSSSEWEVLVRNLHTGTIMHREPTGTRTTTPSDVGAGPTVAIVVKSDGAVAWTNADEGSYQVHAVDKSGSRLLASGRDVDPHSLALAGSTLYWTQGDKPFSAPLN